MRDGSRITEERPRARRYDARTTRDAGAGAAFAGARVSRNARTVGVRKKQHTRNNAGPEEGELQRPEPAA